MVAYGMVFTTPGAITITASYPGGGNFAASQDDEPHQVSEPPPPGLGLTTQPSASATPGLAFDRQPVVQLVESAGRRTATGTKILLRALDA